MDTNNSSKKYRPKVVRIKHTDRCAICGLISPLEYSHIIPQNIISSSPKVNKPMFLDYDGINVIIMCRNHHRLYELARLQHKQFNKIRARVRKAWRALTKYHSELQASGVELTPHYLKKVNDFKQKFEKYGKKE